EVLRLGELDEGGDGVRRLLRIEPDREAAAARLHDDVVRLRCVERCGRLGAGARLGRRHRGRRAPVRAGLRPLAAAGGEHADEPEQGQATEHSPRLYAKAARARPTSAAAISTLYAVPGSGVASSCEPSSSQGMGATPASATVVSA